MEEHCVHSVGPFVSSYCPRKVMLWLPPGTLVFVYGFPCGGLIEDPRVWILLRTRGVLGMVPGDPGNPCFPTNSCGACQSGVSSEALSFLTGDIYLEERLNGKFMVSARSLQKSVPCSGFMKKSAIISSVGQWRTLTHPCSTWLVIYIFLC